jgi:hypothetical protein
VYVSEFNIRMDSPYIITARCSITMA